MQDNADLTSEALSELVNLSPSAVQRRLARLKKDGVISRTVAMVDPKAVGRTLTLRAHDLLVVTGRETSGDAYQRLRDALGNQMVSELLVKTVARRGYMLAVGKDVIRMI